MSVSGVGQAASIAYTVASTAYAMGTDGAEANENISDLQDEGSVAAFNDKMSMLDFGYSAVLSDNGQYTAVRALQYYVSQSARAKIALTLDGGGVTE